MTNSFSNSCFSHKHKDDDIFFQYLKNIWLAASKCKHCLSLIFQLENLSVCIGKKDNNGKILELILSQQKLYLSHEFTDQRWTCSKTVVCICYRPIPTPSIISSRAQTSSTRKQSTSLWLRAILEIYRLQKEEQGKIGEWNAKCYSILNMNYIIEN